MMKIRYLLIEARQKKNLTKSALAKLAGVTHPMIIWLENCKKEGSIETWKSIQKALKIPDSQMWGVINETKYIKSDIEEKNKIAKIVRKAE